MIYSIIYLLFPIWMFYHTRLDKNKNKLKFKLKTESTELNLDLDYNKTGGFDLTKKNSDSDSDSNSDLILQKIMENIRNFNLLNKLQSPFVSEIEKLKYANEILEENKNKNKNTNQFWETYEDIFF